MIFLSFKTYPQATGDNAVELAKKISLVSKQTNVFIAPAAQPFDIYRIKKEVGIEVWAQHLDPIDPGRHFGWLSPYTAKQAGATGAIINHLEHELSFDQIKSTVIKCQEHKLKTLVIVDSIDLTHKVLPLKPDYLAYENADLIGGNVSMVDHDQEGIKAISQLTSIPVLVGAGIKTGNHIKKALSLGASGAILASGVILADDQEKALRNLALGFK